MGDGCPKVIEIGGAGWGLKMSSYLTRFNLPTGKRYMFLLWKFLRFLYQYSIIQRKIHTFISQITKLVFIIFLNFFFSFFFFPISLFSFFSLPPLDRVKPLVSRVIGQRRHSGGQLPLLPPLSSAHALIDASLNSRQEADKEKTTAKCRSLASLSCYNDNNNKQHTTKTFFIYLLWIHN